MDGPGRPRVLKDSGSATGHVILELVPAQRLGYQARDRPSPLDESSRLEPNTRGSRTEWVFHGRVVVNYHAKADVVCDTLVGRTSRTLPHVRRAPSGTPRAEA